jgi:uncharacterized damage-inducible protein DinB
MSTMQSAAVKDAVFSDLERELNVTRKVLERIPAAQFGWKPHEKSMSFGRLAMHVATLPQWMLTTIENDELDFAKPPQMRMEPESSEDLLSTFDGQAAAVKKALAQIDDAALERTWTLRNGDQILHRNSKLTILRIWCLNHMIHHRAQLCVYLRLLNVPVPAVYFNSSDEPQWVFD